MAGEKVRPLSREFGIAESAVRKKIGAQVNKIKHVANQLVEAEENFRSLPISAQISARTLANDLMAISANLASGAKLGSMTFNELSIIANRKAIKLDKDRPNEEDLATIAKLTRVGNDSATVAINLLNANKAAIERVAESEANKPVEQNTDISPADAYKRMIGI
ncbi:hypothetical protein JT25_020845 [Methylomonas denitrificans]|uniref:Uncharacterized protein n=1 Tax=Methylomonas denitrificans TaxID=1538553 RepID=A0A140E678_9GAMM|nr:hypothetical protein JT25_020845 [Methylomonas denitrificans]